MTRKRAEYAESTAEYSLSNDATLDCRGSSNNCFPAVSVYSALFRVIPVIAVQVLLLYTLPAIARAQDIEGRIDGITNGPAAVHAGAGFSVPAGTYIRTGIDGAIGASRDGLSGRADLFTRFHLDPFREHRWAPYGGGGITTRFDYDRRTRAYLLLFIGVDGPASHGVATSIEAGFGGGGRIGVAIRRAATKRR